MRPPDEPDSPAPPVSREELIALVARAHSGSSTEVSGRAGRALAAQSQLPKLVAENLGAGFGQWDFFPDAAEIVDFACAYARPSTEDDLWQIARSWASDDAAGRPTLYALVGRDLLMHELRRIDVPKLRELIDEARPARARELRVSLGLDAPAARAPGGAPAKRAKPAAPKRVPAAVAATGETRMPKPEFKRPAKPPAAEPARRYMHPKFGAGVLESRDGAGPEAKLTIKFESGSKTLLAKYLTEL